MFRGTGVDTKTHRQCGTSVLWVQHLQLRCPEKRFLPPLEKNQAQLKRIENAFHRARVKHDACTCLPSRPSLLLQLILNGRKRGRCNSRSVFRTEKKHLTSKTKLNSTDTKGYMHIGALVTLRFHLKRRTEPVLPRLPYTSRLLPTRLLDFSCAPPTALVALRSARNLSLITSVVVSFSNCFALSY